MNPDVIVPIWHKKTTFAPAPLQNKGFRRLKTKVRSTLFLILSLFGGLSAQQPVQDTLPIDTTSMVLDSVVTQFGPTIDSTSILLDSIIGSFDTPPDTSGLSQVQISESSPDAPINYIAKDSMVYDIENQKILLYGQAEITYTTVRLVADFIELDWANNIVFASGLPDSTGRISGQPTFTDADQEFQCGSMRYNFDTGKGIVYDAATTQNELYVLGERAKFFSAQDTLHTDVIYSKRAIFTTCNHPEPHFGFRSTKQKVIPNEVAVVGPTNLEIMGIPSPVWLPFGFFPLTQSKSTGLIFPRGYEYQPGLGFGLRNVGWYFPINDFMDLQLTTDVYVRGTFRLRGTVNYAKRYKYRGGFTLEYGNVQTENAQTAALERSQNFSIRLQHSQDSKAHPSRTIGGTIDIQTNDARRQNYNDANSQLATNLSSGFNYRESFPNRPFTLSAGMTHSQNTTSREVTINFPNLVFQTQSLYPFRFKSSSGTNPKWYERIAINYKGEAKSTLRATDTTLFTQNTLQNIRYGARHTVDLNTNFKLFKYFNVTPNADYSEIWYFQRQEKFFDPTTLEIVEMDTTEQGEIITNIVDTQYGTVMEDTLTGFTPLRQMKFGASVDTKLFGTVIFNKGAVRGFRHTMTPTLGVSFVPDYTDPKWGYFREVEFDNRFPDSTQTYSIFENGIYGSPSANGEQFLISYGLRNRLETKLYSKKDSSTRNVNLFQRFDFSGSYNLAAEKYKWSTIRLSANTTLFNGITSVIFNSTFDPYRENAEGERIEKLVWDSRRVPARFVNANLRVTTTLTVGKIREMFRRGEPERPDLPGEERETGLLSLIENFSINHSFVLDRTKDGGVDEFRLATNTIYFSGRIDLTEKWRVGVGSFGYDFVNKGLTFPSLSITRDLHCWEMGISWQPTLNTYAFYLRVDPGTFLDFLNVPYRKGSQDPFFNQNTNFGGF